MTAKSLGVVLTALFLHTQFARSEVTLTTMVHFDWTNGSLPYSGLVEGSDGNFYGTLSYGGEGDHGTLFRMSPNGASVILMTFDGMVGSHPCSLVRGKDGNLYGATLSGGTLVDSVLTGEGSVFMMKPDGSISILAVFNDVEKGVGPCALVQGEDGCLYGHTKHGGPGFKGSTFRLTLTGELTIPFSNNVPMPSTLLKAKDGNYY